MAPAREMVMVMSGWDVDFDKKNEIYALNGTANFFRDNPIRIKTGELVRIFLANALEYDPINSLHLHGNYFNLHRTQWKAKPDDFTDVVLMGQAERCILEFVYKAPGMYMFHAHQNTIAESGGMACFRVAACRFGSFPPTLINRNRNRPKLVLLDLPRSIDLGISGGETALSRLGLFTEPGRR
jgi:hypothetical protein